MFRYRRGDFMEEVVCGCVSDFKEVCFMTNLFDFHDVVKIKQKELMK